jgi:PIN like domain
MYSSLFSKGVVLDVEIKEDVLRQRIEKDCKYKLPPGYKDASKPDMGVGDVIIWFTILEIGKKYKKSVVFVSLDQKADWWSQSEGSPLYPRFELVEEFRRISEGQSFHILKFSSFLDLYGASKEVTEEVRQEEVQFRIEHSQEQPKIKLIVLASEIEKELRLLLAKMGLSQYLQGGILNSLKLLESQGFSEIEKADYFWSIYNQNICGRKVDSDEVLLAVDYGLSILKNLKLIRHQVMIVCHPGVTIYSDSDCRQVQESVKGLILEIRNQPGDTFVCFVVYPTTLTHFTKGKILTSEWNMSNIWEESWYQDPETNEIKSAWGSAAEFIGRDLDDIR